MSRTAALLGALVLAGAGFSAEPGIRTVSGDPRAGAARPALSSFQASLPLAERSASEAAPPIRLTASDGTGLSLVALEANGVLEPPLAFTELHLTFENPRDAVIEGRFTIALPPGAALSRFAMKTGGGWQEGEVVERQRARRAYEDFLHRKQDPALLEQEAGNEFSARVFPIPARGQKELVVSYSHAMAQADAPYVLPLHGLARIGRLDVRVLLGDRPVAGADGTAASNLGGEASDRRVVELHKRDWTPDRDLEIGQDRAGASNGLRHANLAVVRVAAPVEAVPQEIAGLYVLVDSSASRALGYAAQVRRLAELVAALRDGKDGAGGTTPLGVAAFDQEVVPMFEGRADGFGESEVRRLRDRRPLGASDLGRALAWLAERLPRHGGKYPRVLLITDGVATAGETETRQLKAAVHVLGDRGVERLDVLAVGGLRDESALRELTTGNLAHDGQRLDGAAPWAEIARRLTLACRSGIKVAVDGAAWVWPESLDGVQPGDEALVYADLPADRPLRLSLNGQPVALRGEPAAAERPLLERAWVQARIERLQHVRETTGDDDLRQALGLEMTKLSVEHRVLSPTTALLVLETEMDYARFGLDRRALADILTVGPGGLDVVARTRNASPSDAVAAAPESIEPSWERRKAAADEPLMVTGEAPSLEERTGISTGSTISRSELEKIPTSRNPSMAAESEANAALEVPGGAVGGVSGGVAGGVPGGVGSGSPAVPRVPPPPTPPGRVIAPGGGAEGSRSREEKEERVAPYTGRFAEVMQHLAAGEVGKARALAESWNAEAPGDVPALLALGEAWEASGDKAGAARAYGSSSTSSRAVPICGGWPASASNGWVPPVSTSPSTPIARPSWTGRTTLRATVSSPGHSCAPATPARPSKRWKKRSTSIIQAGASPASTGSCGKTWGSSPRPGCASSRPSAARRSTASRPTAPISKASRPCASSSPGKPMPTTSTSTSTTAWEVTPTTSRRPCLRAASSLPTSRRATVPSVSPSATPGIATPCPTA